MKLFDGERLRLVRTYSIVCAKEPDYTWNVIVDRRSEIIVWPRYSARSGGGPFCKCRIPKP